MKILIVYYSQTGNTQKIARAIRDGMREEGHAVTLKFLKKVAYDELEAYDMVGLGSPVWYEMPPNVRRFVEEMPPQAGKLAFSFCTHGTMPDLYFPLAVPRLMNKGFRVVDWRDWYGDCTVQIFPDPYYQRGTRTRRIWRAQRTGAGRSAKGRSASAAARWTFSPRRRRPT